MPILDPVPLHRLALNMNIVHEFLRLLHLNGPELVRFLILQDRIAQRLGLI